MEGRSLPDRPPATAVARLDDQAAQPERPIKCRADSIGLLELAGEVEDGGLAGALLNDPELLIVDEPTAGLDPEERIRFRILLGGLTSDRLVILSTHIIGDVEAVANRLVLLKEGRIVGDTTPRQILSEAQGCVWSLVTDAARAGELQAKYKISALANTSEGIVLRLVSATRPTEEAAAVEPTLEDAYLLKMAS
jgi:ABC-2 type transport system ATP-binding protein